MTTDAMLVDIGGHAGALVVHAPERLVGEEIEIARADVPLGRPVHNVVRPRLVRRGVAFAAVFPALPAGTYVPYGVPGQPFTMVGGRVTEIEWTTGRVTPVRNCYLYVHERDRRHR